MAFELTDTFPLDKHDCSPMGHSGESSPSSSDADGVSSTEARGVSSANPSSIAKVRPSAARRARKREALNRDAQIKPKPAKTLGSVLRARRLKLGLTQRELAGQLGVKSAHIAYLELDQRRPSLSLLGRLAALLDLDRERLVFLSHPEARGLFSVRRTEPIRSKDHAWRAFKNDKHMLTRNNVSKLEMKVLSQVPLLGKVSTPRNFLFILNSIRQAVEEEK